MLLPLERVWARLALIAFVFIVTLSFILQSRSTTLLRYLAKQTYNLQRIDQGFDSGLCSLEDDETADRLDSAIAPEVMKVADLESYILELLNLTERGADLPPWLRYNIDNFKARQWEDFETELGYYTNNGVKRLESTGTQAVPFHPYPSYNSEEWHSEWEGSFNICRGARGTYLSQKEEKVWAYRCLPDGFPRPSSGSFEALGMDPNVCYDRYSRYGPYGFKDDRVGDRILPRDPYWNRVEWGKLQDDCLLQNSARYAPHARVELNLQPGLSLPQYNKSSEPVRDLLTKVSLGSDATQSSKKYHSRTAVLLRTWEGYQYTDNDILAIRALITELALHSGGEYTVVLFVNIKSTDQDIFNDPAAYQDLLTKNVPEELRSIALLWTEEVCYNAYPAVGHWNVYWHQWMPVQWFARTHPEFDFFWNWEMDARYTGHHYDFLQSLSRFARKQRRKQLWERNKRFYFPAVHGSYRSFLQDSDTKISQAKVEGAIETIWGPHPFKVVVEPLGLPPVYEDSTEGDTWGIDEEADLITLLPVVNPVKTRWTMTNIMWGYAPDIKPWLTNDNNVDPRFHHPFLVDVPRRLFINTVCRMSRGLLDAMHAENIEGRDMMTELFPASAALHHGLKVVHAPHPIWTETRWPAMYMDAVFNAHSENDTYSRHDLPPQSPYAHNQTGVKHGAEWSERYDSVFAHEREPNFIGWTWYFRSRFAGNIYRRWLGWPVGDKGVTSEGELREESKRNDAEDQAFLGGPAWEEFGDRGPMCLPGMLLHPVKNVVEAKQMPSEPLDGGIDPHRPAEPESTPPEHGSKPGWPEDIEWVKE